MHLPGSHPPLAGEETSKIPNSKRPKARQPRGWRDQVFFPARALPSYSGPYPVATMEMEVPVEDPRVFSNIKRKGKHALRLETVLMTVYYPTNDTGDTLKDDQQKLHRELWLGRPRLEIARGYGKFAGLGELAIPVFLPALFTKLPAYKNAPIANHWAPAVETKSESVETRERQNPQPEQAEGPPVFPLVLFSHGLGGTRTMYSSVCGEFASYGFVVCALEHRDGSGPRTFVNHPKSGASSMKQSDSSEAVDHNSEEIEHGYDTVDYIFPKDNPMDTSPHSEKGVDRELRNAQIALRVAEIQEAYSVMREISNGNGQSVADRNLRRKGFKGGSSYGLERIDWTQWRGRVRMDHVTAAGHSFGAATVVEMLRRLREFPYISQGIIYDIWGAGIRPPYSEEARIRAPLLAINSEAFTYWHSNFDLVDSLVKETQEEPDPQPSWLLTLRGTVHVSQSDFSIMYPDVCSLFLKMVANPKRALDLNINASLEFLKQVMPRDLADVNRSYESEGLLDARIQPLSRVPTTQKHRPSDNWIAARLKIRHEWLFRISPSLFRKIQRFQNERKGKPPETGDETWLHIKPSLECINHQWDKVDVALEKHLSEMEKDNASAEEHGGGKEHRQASAGAEG